LTRAAGERFIAVSSRPSIVVPGRIDGHGNERSPRAIGKRKERTMNRRVFVMLGTAAIGALTIGVGQPSAFAATPVATEIEPANFVTEIDNPWFPLTPGTTMIFEGSADGEPLRVETTVTHETKTILGVECVVVLDRAYEDGELIEETLDWYAQDKDGNVWYFGEASQDIEDGEVASTQGSWEAGVDGAIPGIIMWADPQPGDPYSQEVAPGVAEDMAQVVRTGESVTVPYGTFDDVLVIKEWNPLDPGVVEEKSYASGIGVILEQTLEGENERVELIEIRTDTATPVT
jgi:hypothetical protein